MIAKQLERLITDVSRRGGTEMVQRFQYLRNTSLFPKSRGKNAEDLTLPQIAAGILSIVLEKPGFTIYTNGLLKLKPVGGPEASFFSADTLGKAIETIIENKDALAAFLEMRVSADVQGAGSTARIIYKDRGKEKIAFFIHGTAVSQLVKGAERTYNPRTALSQISTDTVYYPEIFKRIVRSLENERKRKEMDSLSAYQAAAVHS
jgi:hypothetical protein